MREHSFDIEVACQIGVNAAIILKNITFWILKNKANEKHFYDGTWWTYNSIKAFEELYPYMSNWDIRKALSILADNNYIRKGNYNQSGYDRTQWYTVTNAGMILQKLSPFVKDTTPFVNFTNGDAKIHEPIPDSNTVRKPDKRYIDSGAAKNENSQDENDNDGNPLPSSNSFRDFPQLQRKMIETQLGVDGIADRFLLAGGEYLAEVARLAELYGFDTVFDGWQHYLRFRDECYTGHPLALFVRNAQRFLAGAKNGAKPVLLGDSRKNGTIAIAEQLLASHTEAEMTHKDFMAACSKSGNKAANLVSMFAGSTSKDFKTKKEWLRFLAANIEAAEKLADFDINTVKRAFWAVANEEYIGKMSLETVFKWITGADRKEIVRK